MAKATHKSFLDDAALYFSLTKLALWMGNAIKLSPVEIRAHLEHLARFLELTHATLSEKLVQRKAEPEPSDVGSATGSDCSSDLSGTTGRS